MAGTNSILQFGATCTNILTQALYNSDTQRPLGNQSGVARSPLINKVLKQGSLMATGLAQFIADGQANNIDDTLTPANIAAYLKAAVVGNVIPVGTAMLFAQAAAPVGWTQVVTHNDKALRVVSGSPGSGGTVPFTTAFASQTPAGSVSVSAGLGTMSINGTTLTLAQMPSHQHAIPLYGPGSGAGTVAATGASANTTTLGTDFQGGGGSHNHTLAGAPSASGSFSGNAINLAVQYVDVMICTKN